LTKAARPSTDAVVTKVPDASGILRGINLNTKIQFLEGRNANGQRNSIYMNRNRGITLQAKLYVGSSDTNREKDLRSAFEFIGLDKALDSSSKIFVKPNFTFPRPTPGVTTSREVLEDTLRLLSESGVEVFVGESNGGYGPDWRPRNMSGKSEAGRCLFGCLICWPRKLISQFQCQS